jgi:hypothetical protein
MKSIRGRINKNSKSRSHYLTIPASLVTDSAYPFLPGDIVVVKIVKDGLTISKDKEE